MPQAWPPLLYDFVNWNYGEELTKDARYLAIFMSASEPDLDCWKTTSVARKLIECTQTRCPQYTTRFPAILCEVEERSRAVDQAVVARRNRIWKWQQVIDWRTKESFHRFWENKRSRNNQKLDVRAVKRCWLKPHQPPQTSSACSGEWHAKRSDSIDTIIPTEKIHLRLLVEDSAGKKVFQKYQSSFIRY
jgi:hypothetical protein